jgi:choline dehydrogenase-like flavoprotein
MKLAHQFVSAKAWDGFIMERFGPWAEVDLDDDASIEAYLRTTALTFSHILGGSEFSPRGASWGVVDPDLKVKGADSLRVVDASIFVSIVGHYAPVAILTNLS